jgi:N-acetylglucosaminyl-diphospho-decaprenol L-rhamnosyltransferase
MRDALTVCLKSLRREASGAWQIVVVVNGDHDSTASTVANNFPEVELVVNTSNRGVAPARIQGLARARGDVVVLLDADTVVPPGALEGVVATLLSNPKVGLVGPRLIAPDGTAQRTARSFPTVLTKARRRAPKWLARLLPDDSSPNSTEPIEIDYVIGACQVIRRTALDAVGGLDPAIFYGPEDVDLCLRL